MRLAAIPLILATLTAATGFAGQDSIVTGQYIEERSNRVYGCPCEFSSEWADSGRAAVLAWSIQSGEYAGQSLRGLRLVAVLAADFSLSVTLSARRSTVFVDSAALPAQQRAGVAWLRAHYSELLGRVIGEHTAEIEFQLDSDSARVRVGDIVSVRMRRADPARDAESWAFLLFNPLTNLTSSTLAVTLEAEYKGPDLNVRWAHEGSRIAGYFGTFAL